MVSTYAAVDLGSNSFHLKVARYSEGRFFVVDRLREAVRLASGLTDKGTLLKPVQDRALECLQRFGQRIHHIPPNQVRVVGTNTLRSASRAGDFLKEAQLRLGHPVDIISGVEEARLIYTGVASSLEGEDDTRLVMDIGGGSTEVIIGRGKQALFMNSHYMGCVNTSLKYFTGGKISQSNYKKARMAARVEFESIESLVAETQSRQIIGCSGTIRAVEKMIIGQSWAEHGIQKEHLDELSKLVIQQGNSEKLKLPGLSDDRKPVIAGGIAILHAAFEAFNLQQMEVSNASLREGILVELLLRHQPQDVRQATVDRLAKRYLVDEKHAQQVTQSALYIFEQVKKDWQLTQECREYLQWAIRLHEIGITIAHSQFHKHGAYILENADMPGFSRGDQLWLALLVRAQRRKFPQSLIRDKLKDQWQLAQRLAIVMRLSILLHRSRSGSPLPEFSAKVQKDQLWLTFPEQWLDNKPLTQMDLENETTLLNKAGIQLMFQ